MGFERLPQQLDLWKGGIRSDGAFLESRDQMRGKVKVSAARMESRGGGRGVKKEINLHPPGLMARGTLEGRAAR